MVPTFLLCVSPCLNLSVPIALPTTLPVARPVAPPPRVSGFTLTAADRTRRIIRENTDVFTSLSPGRGESVTLPPDLVEEYRRHPSGVIDVLLWEVEAGKSNENARAAAVYALALIEKNSGGVGLARVWNPNQSNFDHGYVRRNVATHIREKMRNASAAPRAIVSPGRNCNRQEWDQR